MSINCMIQQARLVSSPADVVKTCKGSSMQVSPVGPSGHRRSTRFPRSRPAHRANAENDHARQQRQQRPEFVVLRVAFQGPMAAGVSPHWGGLW